MNGKIEHTPLDSNCQSFLPLRQIDQPKIVDKFLLTFLLVIMFALGWAAAFFKASRDSISVFSATKMTALAMEETRADEAYTNQSSPVAIWQLTQLEKSLQDSLKNNYEGPKSLNLKLFLVHARLASLYHRDQKEKEAMEHYSLATNYYNPARINTGYHDAQILDFETMLERLEKFDEIQKLERRSPNNAEINSPPQ